MLLLPVIAPGKFLPDSWCPEQKLDRHTEKEHLPRWKSGVLCRVRAASQQTRKGQEDKEEGSFVLGIPGLAFLSANKALGWLSYKTSLDLVPD